MSKTIKIEMPTTEIAKGQQITFRAPCNCDGVTSLKIGEDVYELLNTSGAPIDNGNVFVKDVLVSVILDTESDNKKAYIQNGSFGGGLKNKVIGTVWKINESTGVKSQRVEVDGVTDRNNVFVDHSSASIVYNDETGEYEGYGAYVDEEKQYLNFITNGYAETYYDEESGIGGIEFFIFGDANNINIPIMIEVL